MPQKVDKYGRNATILEDSIDPTPGQYTPEVPEGYESNADRVYTPTSSFKAGVAGVGSSAMAGVAAVADSLGFEDFADKRLAQAEALRQEAAYLQPDVPSLEEADSASDYLKIVTNGITQNVPVLLALMAEGLVGRKLGGIIGKTRRAANVGTGVGVASGYHNLSAGENFQQLLDDPNITADRRELADAANVTAAKQTAAGLLPLAGLARGVGVLGKGATGGVLQRAVKGAVGGGITEGLTEPFEGYLRDATHSRFNPEVQPLDEEGIKRRQEEAFLGAATGFAFGAPAGAALGSNVPTRTPTVGKETPAESRSVLDQASIEQEAEREVDYLTGALDEGFISPDEYMDRVNDIMERVLTSEGYTADEGRQELSSIDASALDEGDADSGGGSFEQDYAKHHYEFSLSKENKARKIDELKKYKNLPMGWASADAMKALKGDPEAVGSLDRQLERLNAGSNEEVFEKVPFDEALTDKMRQEGVSPKDFSAVRASVAARMFKAEQADKNAPDYSPLFNPDKPAEFLKHFDALKVSRLSNKIKGDTAAFSERDITAYNSKAKPIIRKVYKNEKDIKDLKDFIDNQYRASDATNPTIVTGKRDGEEYRVDLERAVRKMIKRHELKETNEDVLKAYKMAHAALLDKGVQFELTPNTPVYRAWRSPPKGLTEEKRKEQSDARKEQLEQYAEALGIAKGGKRGAWIKSRMKAAQFPVTHTLRTMQAKTPEEQVQARLDYLREYLHPYITGQIKKYRNTYADLQKRGKEAKPKEREQLLKRLRGVGMTGLDLTDQLESVRAYMKQQEETLRTILPIVKKMDAKKFDVGLIDIMLAQDTEVQGLDFMRVIHSGDNAPATPPTGYNEKGVAIPWQGPRSDKKEGAVVVGRSPLTLEEAQQRAKLVSKVKPKKVAAKPQVPHKTTAKPASEFNKDRQRLQPIGPRKDRPKANVAAPKREALKAKQEAKDTKFKEVIGPKYEAYLKKHGLTRSAESRAVEGIRPDTLENLSKMPVADSAKKAIDAWTKSIKLGIDVQVMSAKEAVAWAKRNGRLDYLNGMEVGSLHAFITPVKDGAARIFVHPHLNKELQVEIAAHEFGHAVFRSVANTMDSKTATQILKQFQNWVHRYDKDSAFVDELIKSKKSSKAALLSLVEGVRTRVGDLSSVDRKYLLDFEEWFADNVSTWLSSDKKPLNAVQQFFQKIADFIKQLFGMLPKQNSVHTFMEGIVGGRKLPKDFNPRNLFTPSTAAASLSTGEKRSIANRWKQLTGEDIKESFSEDALARLSAMVATDAYSEITRRALREIYTALLGTEDGRVLGRAALSPHVQRQIRNHVPDARFLDDPGHAVGYMFQLWDAGKIDLGPKSVSIVGKLKDAIMDTVGIVKDSNNAEAIFQDIQNSRSTLTEMGVRDDSIRRITEGSIADTVKKNVGGAWSKLRSVVEKAAYIPDERLRKTKIPSLISLANMLHHKAGTVASDKPMFDAVRHMIGRFNNRISDIYKALDEQQGQNVVSVLNGAKPFDSLTPIEKKAVTRTRKYMRELYNYMKEAGVDVKDRGGNYFPWIIDTEYLEANSEAFHALLNQPKFEKHLIGIAETINTRFAKANGLFSKDRVGGPISTEEIKEMSRGDTPPKKGFISYNQVSEYIHANLVREQGYSEMPSTDVDGLLPAMRSTNTRLLGFIEDSGNAADRAAIAEFLSKNLGTTLMRYTNQAVKRSEYVRRFGNHSEELNSLLSQARKEGAKEEDIDLAVSYVRATMGTYGLHTAKWLHEKFGLEMPKGNSPINDGLQKTMGSVMVFQNLRVLALATLTSFVDPIGIAVRTGDLRLAFHGFKEAMKNIYHNAKGDKTELQSLSEMLGVIDYDLTNEALGWEYGGAYMTGRAHKLNDALFKYSGLNAWTRTTRVMAMAAGKQFIKRHATSPNKHSDRYMAELGITAKDVVLDDAGQLKVLSYSERLKAKPEEVARDDRIRAALTQFVDESILRPNPSQRPLWASDPHYMLFFHLKSFMYSFYDRIMKRAGYEIMQGNYLPVLQLMLYIPVMALSDVFRDLLRWGGDSPHKENWGIIEHSWDAANRSGLLGPVGSLTIDAYRDIQYGGLGITGVSGPTVDTLTNPLDVQSYAPLGNLYLQHF